ncbi:MAG TPA: hypothetical protein VFU16_00605 [Solirubrobacterales bacterium]|nr:hypothetical protein [Solirubrobacterales bacterium]
MGRVLPSRRRFSAAFAATAIAVVAILSLGSGSAAAGTCPNFKVLHDDRIGVADLPAGNYFLQTADDEISCEAAARLFARFLQDWDGNLPKPWLVVSHGTGKASFARRGLPAIYVERISSGANAGGNTAIGKLCPGTFTVNAGTDVGPLFFAKGEYLVYIPAKSAITCRRASILFTRFLAAPGGMLPSPWQVNSQTATFFKPAHALRSAFRIEPEAGVR